MKRMITLASVFMMALCTMLFAGCGKSEFTMTENTEKHMTISALNADKGDFFMIGTLVVEEGEQVVMTADLSKGSIQVELFGSPESQNIEETPEVDGEAAMMADLKTTDSVSGTLPAGDYMIKATCTGKATGTVVVEVTPAN